MNIVAILNDFPYLFRHVEKPEKPHAFVRMWPDIRVLHFRYNSIFAPFSRSMPICLSTLAIDSAKLTKYTNFYEWKCYFQSKWDSIAVRFIFHALIESIDKLKMIFFLKKKLKSILEINRWCCWLVGHLRTFSYVTSWSMFMLDLITLLYS